MFTKSWILFHIIFPVLFWLQLRWCGLSGCDYPILSVYYFNEYYNTAHMHLYIRYKRRDHYFIHTLYLYIHYFLFVSFECTVFVFKLLKTVCVTSTCHMNIQLTTKGWPHDIMQSGEGHWEIKAHDNTTPCVSIAQVWSYCSTQYRKRKCNDGKVSVL